MKRKEFLGLLGGLLLAPLAKYLPKKKNKEICRLMIDDVVVAESRGDFLVAEWEHRKGCVWYEEDELQLYPHYSWEKIK